MRPTSAVERVGRALAVAGACAAGSGCVSARASIGPTTDFGGRYGFVAVAGAGLNLETIKRAPLSVTENVGGGLHPETPARRARGETGPVGAFVGNFGLDYGYVPKKPSLIYRAGVRFGAATAFDGGAPLPPSDPAGAGSSSTSFLTIGGAAAALPLVLHDDDGPTWFGVGPELEIDYETGKDIRGALARLSLAIEYDSLADW